MDRRQFLVSGGLGAGICVVGFLINSNPSGTRDATPDVNGSDTNLAPGEGTTISIRVENVGSVRFSALPDSETIQFDLNAADFSESPSGQDDADPPYWNWSPPDSSVDISAPLSVSDTAKAGEYRYEVTAWNVDVERGPNRSRDDAETVTEEGVVTVTDD